MGNYNNYAFTDGQNLDKSIKEQGWLINNRKFRLFLTSKFAVIKAFYFIGYIKNYLPLYRDLRKNNYSMCFRKPVIDRNGSIKANVDSNLITHVLIKINSYDKAVIVSSDGDFRCLVEHLLKVEKFERVLAPCRDGCSVLLRKAAGSRIDYLDNLKGKLEYKSRRSTP